MDLLTGKEIDSIGNTKSTIAIRKDNSAKSSSGILNDQECTLKIETLSYFLETNCTVDNTHNTPLHYAAKLGDLRLTDNLLKNGVFITTLNSNFNSPLHEAFIHGQEKIVDRLLNFIEQTSNYLNLKNNHGLTHLHIASTRKNAKIIQSFIEVGESIKDVVNKESPYYAGYTALQFAVEFKSLEVLEVLVSLGKMNGYNKDGLKTVRQQHMFRSFNVALIEMHHNARFKYTNPNWLNDFHMSCFKEESEVVKIFLEKGEDVDSSMNRRAVICPLYTPLHFAVEANRKESVKLLTQYGADIEKRNGHCMTPLHLAFYYENCKENDTIVDHLYNILVNKKANLMDSNGLTYFHIAVSRNDLTWVRNMLNQGENVNSSILCNSRNFSFYTPLNFAARYGHLQMAELLIERGAKINGNEDRHGDTPLQVACEFGHMGLINLLLKNGANVKAQRLVDGKTAIHLLVEFYLSLDGEDGKKEQIVNSIGHLVDFGCDVNVKDVEENTALHIACCKFPAGAKCAEALVIYGANVNLEDELGQTPLTCTFYFDYQENGLDYVKMYNHVQNLKALGMEVNPKNDRFCDMLMKEKDKWDVDDRYNEESIMEKAKQRFIEIERMKVMKLTKDLSLYDYIKLPSHHASIYIMNYILRYIVLDIDLQKYYPMYGYLILAQYGKAYIHQL